jgi:predicted outer membrane repeat protein
MEGLIMRRSAPLLALQMSVLLLVFGRTEARTWHILPDGTGDAPTIQAGVDSSATGDTVLVAAGTYVGRVRVADKAIVLKSADGPALTTISGGNVPDTIAVVALLSGSGIAPVLEGFSITGGFSPSGLYGGGVFCQGGAPEVRGNRIFENSAGYGAGLCANWGTCLVRDNVIERNSAGFHGGAIHVWPEARVTIIGNAIRENRAWFGGGVSQQFDGSSLQLLANTIADNTAQLGGGLYSVGTVTLEDNLILRNHAVRMDGAGYGGGAFWLQGNAVLRRNLFAGNTAEDDGGGLYMAHSTTFTFEGCSLAANTAPDGSAFYYNAAGISSFSRNLVVGNLGGMAVDCHSPFGPYVSFACNDIWGNPGGGVGGTCSDPTGLDGNFSEDPLFCDPAAGDYSLRTDSPCMEGYGCGQIGALGAGCTPTATETITWGRLRLLLR